MDSMFRENLSSFAEIQSGMHVALLGTTRGGKTTLATGGKSGKGLLRHWENALILDSTGDPGAIAEYGKPLNRRGYIKGHMRLTVNSANQESREKIHRAIGRALSQGNIVIYADEVRQLADRRFFNLQSTLEHVWLFGAKKGVSLMGGTQAPRWIPSPLYDQSKTHFIFGMRDRRAMKRLAEISGDVDTLEAVIPSLQRYEFACVDMFGDVTVSKFEMPPPPSPEQKREPIKKATKFQIRKSNKPKQVQIG